MCQSAVAIICTWISSGWNDAVPYTVRISTTVGAVLSFIELAVMLFLWLRARESKRKSYLPVWLLRVQAGKKAWCVVHCCRCLVVPHALLVPCSLPMPVHGSDSLQYMRHESIIAHCCFVQLDLQTGGLVCLAVQTLCGLACACAGKLYAVSSHALSIKAFVNLTCYMDPEQSSAPHCWTPCVHAGGLTACRHRALLLTCMTTSKHLHMYTAACSVDVASTKSCKNVSIWGKRLPTSLQQQETCQQDDHTYC